MSFCCRLTEVVWKKVVKRVVTVVVLHEIGLLQRMDSVLSSSVLKLIMIVMLHVMWTEVGVTNSSITPTVELNALAMKRGELAVYRPIESKPLAPAPHYCIQTYSFRGGFFNHRWEQETFRCYYAVMLLLGCIV